MTTKTRKVKISRKTWLRGSMDSYMVNTIGQMCCLGFAANQISRISKKRMRLKSGPEDVYQTRSFLTFLGQSYYGDDGVVVLDNTFANQAMVINDNCQISDKVREYQLKRLFKKNDIELTFVD